MEREPLSNEQILQIVANELNDAIGGDEKGEIESSRKAALSTYLGDPGDVEEYKSSVVSTDVADAIEWIMPEVVKAFTQNNEVVTFDAVSAKDKRQAEIESRYVYDVIMKENNGFITIHEFIKDALMQKNGFFKVHYEKEEDLTKASFTGLTQPEYILLQQDPEVEIVGETVTEVIGPDGTGSIPTYDVNLVRKKVIGRTVVRCVAPENFRVNRRHNSVDLSCARFTAESMTKTRSELIEDGFDQDIVESLTASNGVDEDGRDYRFTYQGENTASENVNNIDKSMDLIEISECYLKMDIDGDGVSELCKVTVDGYNNPSVILEIEEVDENPFVSATAILMSHKLFGLSIYDRLKEIQKQKTALWRNILDNMYLQNNQRTVVIEGQVNLDDLLISRPGGVIRAKTANAVQPYQTPALPSDAYRMLDYLDQVRAGRSGVSPEGSIHDSAMGDNVGSQGLEQLLTQKEELVGLMVRVIAETGIKPLCEKIRNILINHKDVSEDYEFHGEWLKITPKDWIARKNSTVRVGTGSGNRKQQAAGVGQIMTIQEKILANPGQSLVTERQIFAAIDDFAKFSGMPGASTYFLDPNSPEGKENKQRVDQATQQKQMQELQEKQLLATAQTKIAEAETVKAQAAQESVYLKGQLENQKQQVDYMKAQSDNQIKMLKQQLDEANAAIKKNGMDEEMSFKYWQQQQQIELEYYRIDKTASMKAEEPKSTGEGDERAGKDKAGD